MWCEINVTRYVIIKTMSHEQERALDVEHIENKFSRKLRGYRYVDHCKSVAKDMIQPNYLFRHVIKTEHGYKIYVGGRIQALFYDHSNKGFLRKIRVIKRSKAMFTLQFTSANHDLFLFCKKSSAAKNNERTKQWLSSLTREEKKLYRKMRKIRDKEPDKCIRRQVSMIFYTWLYKRRPDMDERFNSFYNDKKLRAERRTVTLQNLNKLLKDKS